MNIIKLSENDVEQALNFVGVDKDTDAFKKIMGKLARKKVGLSELKKACMEAKFNDDIPASSFDLATYYQLLLKCCHGNKEKVEDMENILSTIEKISCIDVMPENSEDYITNFLRTNNVLIALMKGVLYFETPSDLKRILSNDFSPSECFYEYAIPYYKHEPDKFKFYALLTLSKLKDTKRDYRIFDDDNEICQSRLLNAVADGIDNHIMKDDIYSSATKNDTDDIEEKESIREILPSDVSQKRLVFRRPTFLASKELTPRQCSSRWHRYSYYEK